MPRIAWKFWAAAVVSAGLLELPFPLAGPLPPWRAIFAWFGLAPLLWAVMSLPEGRRAPRQAFLISYVCGVLWYAGNCYWIYATMLLHGGLSPLVSALMLAGFSLVLGGYFGLFGLGLALIRRATGSRWKPLALAPVLWVALDLANARITSVPWDQLGYSQVDNALLIHFAPWTGVYGLTYILVAVNGLIAGGFTREKRQNIYLWILDAFVLLFGGAFGGMLQTTPKPVPTATAVLVQPNLDVSADNVWPGAQWNQHIAQFTQLAEKNCGGDIEGIPQTGAAAGEIPCSQNAAHPDLVAWPEAPAPFVGGDPRFQQAMAGVAQAVHAPLVVGGIGTDYSQQEGWLDYNSAMIFAADGSRIGRYDKIHLVPFGEYVPYRNLFFFAHKLTGKVSDFSRGTSRRVFRIPDQQGHMRAYGVFICYESVFGDEVRHFALNGAEVLVNISDDGWYGDTSAPWQHLNMARMRAIENRRWLLRDTNNGVTAAIDPYGRVRQSIARHQVGALAAQFGFRDDVTFYTKHGDVFAWCCVVLAGVVLVWAGNGRRERS
jgi:apolipoprotein N-acyltransferase